MREFASSFYHSRKWLKARKYVIERDMHLCQQCLKRGKIRTADVVHHITELTPDNINDPRINVNPENLISLCQDCHAEVHRTKREDDRFYLDEFGNVIIKEKGEQ